MVAWLSQFTKSLHGFYSKSWETVRTEAKDLITFWSFKDCCGLQSVGRTKERGTGGWRRGFWVGAIIGGVLGWGDNSWGDLGHWAVLFRLLRTRMCETFLILDGPFIVGLQKPGLYVVLTDEGVGGKPDHGWDNLDPPYFNLIISSPFHSWYAAM